MSKEAMKLALEALEDFEDAIRYDNEQDDIGARVCCGVLSYNPHTKDCKSVKAITALREALAQERSSDEQPAPVAKPHEQEPVGYADKIAFESAMKVGKGCDVWPVKGDYEARTGRKLTALYTSPPAQRKPYESPYNPNPVEYQYHYPDGSWMCSNGETINGMRPDCARSLYALKDNT